MPVTKERKQPSAKFRSRRARRSTTGRAKVRLRTMNRMPEIAAIQAQAVIVASSNQF
jgi:hypothetical protein